MKMLLVSCLVLSAVMPAFAQQPPVPDPQVTVYRQLLDEANSRIAASNAGAQVKIEALQKQIADLQKQLDAAKSKDIPPPDAKSK